MLVQLLISIQIQHWLNFWRFFCHHQIHWVGRNAILNPLLVLSLGCSDLSHFQDGISILSCLVILFFYSNTLWQDCWFNNTKCYGFCWKEYIFVYSSSFLHFMAASIGEGFLQQQLLFYFVLWNSTMDAPIPVIFLGSSLSWTLNIITLPPLCYTWWQCLILDFNFRISF